MTNQKPVYCDSDPNAISIEQALQRILQTLVPVQSMKSIACSDALSRVTAEQILSPISVPSFRASSMDGYAVRVEDCHTPLQVTGQSMAGHPGVDNIPPGTCQRITTGARVPDEANAVVQQENVTLLDDIITVNHSPDVGLNIRNPGSDSQAGTCLLPMNCRLGAAQLALLAAHGITRITVRKRLKVAVFSTGDELVNADTARSNGQIFDANRPLLKALLDNPAIELIDLDIARDTTQSINAVLDETQNADVIISSGGVSVGDADHVRTVLEQRGEISLWKIAMKPGRPLTFGLIDDGTPYFGLPGNPVSAAITCLLFVKPAIACLMGVQEVLPPPMHLPLKGNLKKNPGRVEYQRGQIVSGEQGGWLVSTTGLQDSHVLSSLHQANCLIELPIDSAGAMNGDRVKVYPFSHFSQNRL